MCRRGKTWMRWPWLLVIALLALPLTGGGAALAQDIPDHKKSGSKSTIKAHDVKGEYENVRGKCATIREDIRAKDRDGVYLSEYIVTCVRTVVTDAFANFIAGFYPAVEDAIGAAVTLAVLFLGAGLATGMIEKTSRDSFIVLVKIASVLYFVQVSTVMWVYESGLDTMSGFTDTVFQFGAGSTDGRCKDNDTLWDRVDCMLDAIIGLREEEDADAPEATGGEETGIARGMLHFFFSNAFSSGIGLVIGLLGLYVMFSFVMAVIKSIHTYLSAILGMAFILMVMPLFVPFILFKSTRNFFDKWYRIAVSFILQPVLLFGFLSLMMIAFEHMLVDGPNSMLCIAMGEDACTEHAISRYYENHGIYKSTTLDQYHDVGFPEERAAEFSQSLRGVGPRMASDRLMSEMGPEALQTFFTTSRHFDAVDYERLADLVGASDEAEIQERLVLSTITLALASFVFLTMLNYIPAMATDLAGGVFEVPNLYEKVGSNFIGQSQAEMLARDFSRRVRGSIDPDDPNSIFARASNLVSQRR